MSETDLFGDGASENKRVQTTRLLTMANTRPLPAPADVGAGYISCECGWCGKKHGAHLRHYGILRTNCGHFLWALQPKRNGPLVLVPWPGLPGREAM